MWNLNIFAPIVKRDMNTITVDPERLERAAGILKALAHPVRISILNALDGGKSLTVTEIHNLLQIEQSMASHHLNIMKDRGALISRREGKKIYYSIRSESIRKLLNCLSNCEK